MNRSAYEELYNIWIDNETEQKVSSLSFVEYAEAISEAQTTEADRVIAALHSENDAEHGAAVRALLYAYWRSVFEIKHPRDMWIERQHHEDQLARKQHDAVCVVHEL